MYGATSCEDVIRCFKLGSVLYYCHIRNLSKLSGDNFFIKFYLSLVKSHVISRREQIKNYPKIKTKIT